MATALKKLFRSSERGGEDRERTRHDSGSPTHPTSTRRFLNHCASPRSSRRDSKVSPADGASAARKGHRSHSSNGFFKSKSSSSSSKDSSSALTETVTKNSHAIRTRRLMKEFHEICKTSQSVKEPPFSAELVDDNLYEWNIKLFQIDPESAFYKDMQETGTTYVLLNVTFPDTFPFAPPFMRVISPLIEKGFVMDGGAICMELLTPRGWASAYTVEAVIMQFSASLVKGQGRIPRKCKIGKEFSRKLAEASFRSLVKTHDKYGWVTPPMSDG
ncbi:ubiquitin-conjugating enzyme E2Q-like protein 1 [Limulus polyphemus]|uniref:Ubiquitin-conjugating enzyme E2Q-like protein 1 n=1 Tax=Limulus polyphemus TaxID=6850 RepID=A0ABM1B540_LIMPO|nr:ubiquitin-conjugating enzyme E2Q-like protein 1 [Limulus polyphemus]XP_022242164.1 ubiquitin-conjugating enzyme E2Q-like protein 1 [Limulus polyphemus]XP_022242165.1 ubiquitin-conjugating enzyme E2Q-like protein 1 [Limulus polyphemus]XP_022242166.1 ubiquitin-conjugating enzyme E2Q-like protein 1 [Limulus polyphemus]